MSVAPDDILSQFSGAPGALAPAGAPLVPNAPAAAPITPPQSPAAQIPADEAAISQLEGKQAGVIEAEQGLTQQVESELGQMQPPQRNMDKAMTAAPLLIGLMAIGGAATKTHGISMLSGLNGAVSGMLKGNQQAFEDNWKKYTDNKSKLLEMYELQQHYYDTIYKSYGENIKNKENAIRVARELTNDQWSHEFKQMQLQNQQEMNEMKAWYMQQSLVEKMKALDDKVMFEQMKNQIDLMRALAYQADVNSKVQQRQQIIQQKINSPQATTKDIDGMIKDVNIQMSALKRKYSDIETMSLEDKQKYDALLNEMGQLEVGRKLLTPVPVSDPSEVDGLDDGQRYVTPDGAIRIKGSGNSDSLNPTGAPEVGAPGAGRPPAPGGNPQPQPPQQVRQPGMM